MANETLLDMLSRSALQRSGTVAIADRETSLEWADLTRAIKRIALRLREEGIRPGDRVLIDFDRSAFFAIAYFAVHAAGGVCVIQPSNSTTTRRELAEHAETKAVLDLEEVSRLSGPGPERGFLPEVRPEHPADILYTTGTTSAPKGVVLTHSNIANAARNTCASVDQNQNDIELCTLSFTHSFGLGRLRAMACAGNTLIIEPGMVGFAHTLEIAAQRQVSTLPLAPSGLALLKRLNADSELAVLGKSLRSVELLGEALAPEVRAWAVDRLPGVRLSHNYGLTEASRAASVDLSSEDARLGSSGRPAPNVTIESREGELWIHGPIVATGYWRDPELSAQTFVDGGVRTHDLGEVDAAGRLFLTGRASEIINVGGIKIAPEEVEAAVAGHPDVLDVACTAIADPQGITGERVAAFIVGSRDLDARELGCWLRERGVDSVRVPAYVERVESLPRAASGKLLRRKLTRSK